MNFESFFPKIITSSKYFFWILYIFTVSILLAGNYNFILNIFLNCGLDSDKIPELYRFEGLKFWSIIFTFSYVLQGIFLVIFSIHTLKLFKEQIQSDKYTKIWTILVILGTIFFISTINYKGMFPTFGFIFIFIFILEYVFFRKYKLLKNNIKEKVQMNKWIILLPLSWMFGSWTVSFIVQLSAAIVSTYCK